MLTRIISPLLLLAFAWFIVSNDNAKTIIAGIAIFLIGMHYMENGFKLFSGGMLETALERFTKSTPRALATGFVATAVVQSSSLISVIIISFLSAELIGLTQAVGVVFGSNIGTTTTAWLVSSFGLKIKIAQYALPMLIFGVIFQFSHHQGYKGLGNVLIGLGFIFLGIDYMKDGFETLKQQLDLAQYAMSGFLGTLIYILLGAIATVIIQSSSATMAIIITALASGQIEYVNALALAIGANVGTTVTAILGAMASNKSGKRLAVAHLIFNAVTGLIAMLFLDQLSQLVDLLSPMLAIAPDNFAMKLALFHTLFNVIGVLVMTPFIHRLVDYLKTLFRPQQKGRGKAKYLTAQVMEIPASALAALRKETEHLYDKSLEAIVHAMNLHRSEIFSETKVKDVVAQSTSTININIDEIYQQELKQLYSEIIYYASLSQELMDVEGNKTIHELKEAARQIIEMVKDVRELQRNLNRFRRSKNAQMIHKYNKLRALLVKVLRRIQEIRHIEGEEAQVLTEIEVMREKVNYQVERLNQEIDGLIRSNEIDSIMASSLINDVGFTSSICKKFLNAAVTLWVHDRTVRNLVDAYET